MSMNIKIRQERTNDYKNVFKLIEKAFKNEEFTDHQEQFLVERLRKSDAFIPELSLVAEYEDKLVGFILLTEIKIVNNSEIFDALALAPVAVLPDFQNMGIGGKLIIHAHTIAKDKGHKSVILLGHEKYYPRFGYVTADKFGIQLPFEAPKENCMIIELIEGGLTNVHGVVEYLKEFFE